MANETLKIDSNNKPVIGLVTDDVAKEIRMGRIDDTTKGLKVTVVGGSTTGVSSLNTLTGAITLAAGANITLTPVANTITIASSGGASGITVGTTTVTSGTTTRILYNNAGVVGEYVISGTGNVAMTTSPVFTTPNIGSATGSVSGNAGTATALQNARTIGGVSFDGTANIVPQTIQSVNEATDTTCFPLFISASGSQSLQPLNNTSLTFNSNTAQLGATTFNAGTGYQIAGGATSGKILIGNGTNFIASTPTYPTAAGTSGNVLTSDGTNWTSAAPAGASTPKITISTCYESTSRLATTTTGQGAITISNNGGLSLRGSNTTATGSAQGLLRLFTTNGSTTFPIFNANPTIGFVMTNNTDSFSGLSTTAQGTLYLGLGVVTVDDTGHTFTDKHIGFKIVANGSNVSLYATQADGSTETVSSALTTITSNDTLELIALITSGTSTAYYWRKNGGALSSATTLSTNMPTGSVNPALQNSISTDNVSNANLIVVNSQYYQR